jgi:hypothetical protein
MDLSRKGSHEHSSKLFLLFSAFKANGQFKKIYCIQALSSLK